MMKKGTIAFIVILIFASCNSLYDISRYNGYHKKIYKFKNVDINYSVRLYIPANNIPIIRLGGDIQSFHYSDGSAIYIGENSRATPNLGNIEKCVDSIEYSKRVERIEFKYEVYPGLGIEFKKPDTIILEGIDSLGRFWKDIRVDYMCYGYISVPQKRKNIFDKSLLSIKINKSIESKENTK